MAWIEAATGFVNLARAQRISIEPSDRDPGHWVVLAHFGPHRHFVASFPTRIEAGEYVADVLWGDDQ